MTDLTVITHDAEHGRALRIHVLQLLDEAADDMFRDEASEPMRRAV